MFPIYEFEDIARVNDIKEGFCMILKLEYHLEFIKKHILQNCPEGIFLTVNWIFPYNQFTFKKEGDCFKIISCGNSNYNIKKCKILFGEGYFNPDYTNMTFDFHSDLNENVIKEKYLDQNGNIKIDALSMNEFKNFILNKGDFPDIELARDYEGNNRLTIVNVGSKRNHLVRLYYGFWLVGIFDPSQECNEKMTWVVDDLLTLLSRTPIKHIRKIH